MTCTKVKSNFYSADLKTCKTFLVQEGYALELDERVVEGVCDKVADPLCEKDGDHDEEEELDVVGHLHHDYRQRHRQPSDAAEEGDGADQCHRPWNELWEDGEITECMNVPLKGERKICRNNSYMYSLAVRREFTHPRFHLLGPISKRRKLNPI